MSCIKYAIRHNTDDLAALAQEHASELDTVPEIGASLIGYAAILNAGGSPCTRQSCTDTSPAPTHPLHRHIPCTDTSPAHPRRADAIPVLVASGADVNSVADASGRTPLELAARHKNVDAMNALIAAGADVGALKNRGARKAAMRAYLNSDAKDPAAAFAFLSECKGPVLVSVAW